jgi:hypothetical protein
MTVLAGDQHTRIFALDLQRLSLPSDDAVGPIGALTAPANAVVDLGGGGGLTARLSWPNAANIVTISSYGAIVNIDLLTRSKSILLKQDEAQICSVSWTPDGTQLAFSLCAPGNFEIAGARPQLYVYTP